MNPRLMVTASLLVVAIVAFTGLAYQTVPVGTTQTVIQQSTETKVAYSNYVENTIITYTTQAGVFVPTSTYVPTIEGLTTYSNGVITCVPGIVGEQCDVYIAFLMAALTTFGTYSTTTMVSQYTYQMQITATISYSRTVTSSVTESSTTIIPLYSNLGLNDASFGGLAILVIAALALAMFTFKHKHQLQV